MGSVNKFNPGDSVLYRNGMDFKDFNGIVEKCIDYKGLWHYLIKDIKDNSFKRVGERFLSYSVEIAEYKSKSKFKVGDSVKYREERTSEVFNGIVERSIYNYQGEWKYIIKDGKMNVVKKISEKHLEFAH